GGGARRHLDRLRGGGLQRDHPRRQPAGDRDVERDLAGRADRRVRDRQFLGQRLQGGHGERRAQLRRGARRVLDRGRHHQCRLHHAVTAMTLRAVALPLAAAAGLGLLGGVLVEYFNDERPRQVQDERIKLYPDIDACQAEQSAETCDKAFAEASRSHVATAPRFESRAACEAEYGAGRCLENGGAGGGSWFLPAMAGFMLGRALGGSTPLAQPVYCDRGGAAFGGSERL